MPQMNAAAARPQLKAAGCTDADLAALYVLYPNLDWANLLAVCQAYGDCFVKLMLAVLGGAVLPVPLPALLVPAAPTAKSKVVDPKDAPKPPVQQ